MLVERANVLNTRISVAVEHVYSSYYKNASALYFMAILRPTFTAHMSTVTERLLSTEAVPSTSISTDTICYTKCGRAI